LPHQVEQSAVIRRTLFQSARMLAAKPEYLARHRVPARAADLAGHFLLLPSHSRQRNSNYVQVIENGEPVQVIPLSSMDGNDVLLHAAALAGAGIAELPEAMTREDIALGKLVPVLPGCSVSGSDVELCLFYSHRELLPARFRTFIDFCTEFFRRNDGRNRRARLVDTEAQAA
jgi:DNA-binding transcriptional LysR family regulator